MTRTTAVQLPVEAVSATMARRAVLHRLSEWGFGSDRPLLDDAALLVSELVSNAIRGASGQMEVSVTLVDGGVEISVTDASPMLPVLGRPAPDDLSGRGLPILAAVSEEWGYETRGTGKRVWGRLGGTPELGARPADRSDDRLAGALGRPAEVGW